MHVPFSLECNQAFRNAISSLPCVSWFLVRRVTSKCLPQISSSLCLKTRQFFYCWKVKYFSLYVLPIWWQLFDFEKFVTAEHTNILWFLLLYFLWCLVLSYRCFSGSNSTICAWTLSEWILMWSELFVDWLYQNSQI